MPGPRTLAYTLAGAVTAVAAVAVTGSTIGFTHAAQQSLVGAPVASSAAQSGGTPDRTLILAADQLPPGVPQDVPAGATFTAADGTRYVFQTAPATRGREREHDDRERTRATQVTRRDAREHEADDD